jgi:hypothetical protein
MRDGVIRPKRAFYAWLGREAVDNEHQVVLVPDLDGAEECKAYLIAKGRFSRVFRDILRFEKGEESAMPDLGDFGVFTEFFEVEYHPFVYDLADDYLPVSDADPQRGTLHFTDGTPNWYIASCGLMSPEDFEALARLPDFEAFEDGYSNQPEYERYYRKLVRKSEKDIPE